MGMFGSEHPPCSEPHRAKDWVHILCCDLSSQAQWRVSTYVAGYAANGVHHSGNSTPRPCVMNCQWSSIDTFVRCEEDGEAFELHVNGVLLILSEVLFCCIIEMNDSMGNIDLH